MSAQQVAENGLASQVASTLRGMRVVDLSPTLQRGIPNWPMHPPLVIDKARDEANKPMLSSPDKIYPGQMLRIPPQ